MAMAIARSNPVPSLGNSAGARLTVTRRCGNLKPALRIAGLTRSRASWIARSVRPTIVKAGRPLAMSASTVTGTPARPLVAQLMANAITQTSVASTGCRRRRPTWCLSYRRRMPTDTTKARRSAAARVPPAFSRDPKFEALAESCTRFLLGHGRRSADELLATIPRSTKIDYYGVGGAATELEEEV